MAHVLYLFTIRAHNCTAMWGSLRQQVNTPNSRQAYSIDIIDIAVCTYSVYGTCIYTKSFCFAGCNEMYNHDKK